MIAGVDAVEAARLVGDHAGEDVEPAGRAFRIGGGGDVVGQRQAFDQRHDVDAAGLQHRAVGQLDLVQLQLVDALGDRRARPGQEARAHAIGDLAEPQVEARRLDLVGREVARADESPPLVASAAIMWSGRMPLSLDGECRAAIRGRAAVPSGAAVSLRSKPDCSRLDGKRGRTYDHSLIPWSFEPAGLQPRKTNC